MPTRSDPSIRAALAASLRAHRIAVAASRSGGPEMSAASLAGFILEHYASADKSGVVIALALEYIARVQDEERAPTLPPIPAAVDHAAIVTAIRAWLGTASASVDELLVESVAERLGVPEERVHFAVTCMLEDGGLRRTERRLLYVPLPDDDAEPYDPPAASPYERAERGFPDSRTE